MENVRKYRDIKLVATERRRNYLVSDPNYHTTNFFMENLLAIEKKKAQILMIKPAYKGLPILDLSKAVMYDFSMIIKNHNTAKMKNFVILDTNSFIVHVKTDNIYKDIAEVVEKRFDTLKYLEIDIFK